MSVFCFEPPIWMSQMDEPEGFEGLGEPDCAEDAEAAAVLDDPAVPPFLFA
jgi:hypothetical protein